MAWFAIGSRGWPASLFFMPQAPTACWASSTSCSSCPQLLLLLVAINSATGIAGREDRGGVEGLMPVVVAAAAPPRRSRCSSSRGTAAAILVYERFFREEPAPYFASDEDHFLFGSIGTEAAEGLPYWIWLVLPRVFPDLLPAPGGYASLGLLSEDGHELPIGLSKVTVGFPRVGINCAMCHAASYRTRPDEPPTIVAAAAVASDVAAAVLPLPVRRRRRPALQRATRCSARSRENTGSR